MYKIIFVSGLLCFGLFLLISIILFVKNDIGTIIGELTGLRAKHTIRKMLKVKSEKAQAMKDSHLGENISVRTSELIEDMIKKDDEDKSRTEEINENASEEMKQQPVREEEPVKESIFTGAKMEASNGESVFEAEEEMTVLGGEAFKRVSSKNSVEDVSYEAENLEEPETGILSKAQYAEVLQKTQSKEEEVKSVSSKGERTQKRKDRQLRKEKEALLKKETEQPEVQEEHETSVLSEDMESTAIEEAVDTMVLQGEDATGVLLQKGELDDAK